MALIKKFAKKSKNLLRLLLLCTIPLMVLLLSRGITENFENNQWKVCCLCDIFKAVKYAFDSPKVN